MGNSKSLLQFTMEGQTHSVRATEHALERMEQRKVNKNVVLSEVVALGVDEVKKYKKEGKDVAIIDEDKDIAVIIAFDKNTIQVVTVIDKADIFVKRGTSIKKMY